VVGCGVQMDADNLDFFPMNRALALADEDVDETDGKLEQLIAQVDLLVRSQRQQVWNIIVYTASILWRIGSIAYMAYTDWLR